MYRGGLRITCQMTRKAGHSASIRAEASYGWSAPISALSTWMLVVFDREPPLSLNRPFDRPASIKARPSIAARLSSAQTPIAKTTTLNTVFTHLSHSITKTQKSEKPSLSLLIFSLSKWLSCQLIEYE
jgi:hypothetical protein